MRLIKGDQSKLPFQLSYLLILVVLFGLDLSQDVEESLHLRLSLVGFVLVVANLLLQQLHSVHILRIPSGARVLLHLVDLLYAHTT